MPPPPPLYAYHYWKCYHKEGTYFQTASLYSVEVDYYNFGTCEMAGGSYFCGDHSCNTFKYVNGKRGSTIMEQPALDMFQPNGNPGNKKYEPIGHPIGAYDNKPINTYGSGVTDGNRDDTGKVVNANIPQTNAFVQTDLFGYPLRADAAAPQYHLYDSMKALPAAIADASGVAVTDDQFYKTTKHHHLTETIVAGACKAKCDNDITCRAFQENRWQFLHVAAKCTTFHFGPKLLETQLLSNLTPTDAWDFFGKYTEAKSPTYLHAPITTSYSPTTAGGPKYQGWNHGAYGRRLEGVY